MLTATGANVLKINRNTTAIANHLSLSFFLFNHYTIFIGLSNKKNERKKYFLLAHDLLYANIIPNPACHFGSFRAISAILAVSLAIAHLASR
jgi:hypothetical protein